MYLVVSLNPTMNEETSLYCFNELLPKSIHNVLFVSELVTGFFFREKKKQYGNL